MSFRAKVIRSADVNWVGAAVDSDQNDCWTVAGYWSAPELTGTSGYSGTSDVGRLGETFIVKAAAVSRRADNGFWRFAAYARLVD